MVIRASLSTAPYTTMLRIVAMQNIFANFFIRSNADNLCIAQTIHKLKGQMASAPATG